MALSVSCSSCGHQLRLKPEYAGKRGRCPKCGHVFVVPLNSAPAPTTLAAQEPPPPKPTAPSRPQQFASTASGAVPITFTGMGWDVPGGMDALPFGWLRHLLYQTFATIWLGRILDDSLTALLSDDTRSSRMAIGDEAFPPGVSEAVRIATAVGISVGPSPEHLELNRIQIGYAAFKKPKGILSLLATMLWTTLLALFALYVILCAVLRLVGLAIGRRIMPTFIGGIIHRYQSSALFGHLILGPILWGIGLFVGLFALVLLVYSAIWPPLLLKRLARTGDVVLTTPSGFLFYSSFHQAAVLLPAGWPLIQGRFKKYYIPLSRQENADVEICSAWVVRLPEEWVDDDRLNIVPRQGAIHSQMIAQSRLLFGKEMTPEPG